MALRSRTRTSLSDPATGSALFDSITDLQRLDGVGPARPRPREPPPPPPPPSQDTNDRPATPPPRSRTESESGYDVTFKETLKESGSNLLPFKDHELKDSNVNNKQRNYNKKLPSVDDKKSIPNKQLDKLEYFKETNKNKEKETLKLNNNQNKTQNIADKRIHKNTNSLQNGFREIKKEQTAIIQDMPVPESPPPAVPPRKRSNSRTPPVANSIKNVNDAIIESPGFKTNGTLKPNTNGILQNTPKKDQHISRQDIHKPQTKTEQKQSPQVNGENYHSTNYQTFRIEANNTNYEDVLKVDNISITSPISVSKHENNPTVKIEPSKTIVQINSPTLQVIPSTVHRLQIRNEFSDHINYNSVSITESPQRKTSIMINGDDCYSTVNVNDDIPIYQSSVVVNDCESNKIEVNSGGTRSSVYITGGFQNTPAPPRTNNTEDNSNKTLVIFDNNSSISNTPSPSISSGSSTPETIGKTFVLLQPENEKLEQLEQAKIEKRNEMNKLKETEIKDTLNDKPSNEELQRLLKDPVEAVKRNLVPHVCGKADVERKPKNKKVITSNTLVARLLEDPFLGSLAEGLETDTVAKLIEDSLLKLRNQENQDDDKDISSENESCPPYELMEMGSDCYSNHSNRSSVTEDELSTRSKFYQLLADSSLTEVEEHHYESIRPNSDPIYEEIEIPPPLPANPPPSSIIDDLQIDKQFTTR